MDKVLVKLHVPVVDAHFDVKIPLDKKLYKTIYLFIKAVYDLTEEHTCHKVLLIYMKNGLRYDMMLI